MFLAEFEEQICDVVMAVDRGDRSPDRGGELINILIDEFSIRFTWRNDVVTLAKRIVKSTSYQSAKAVAECIDDPYGRRAYSESLEIRGAEMTFEQYIEACGEELTPWQREAARKFLEVLYMNREGGSGKTWLVERLQQFLNEFGNTFTVDKGKVMTYRPLYQAASVTAAVVSEEQLDRFRTRYVLENGHEVVADSRRPYSFVVEGGMEGGR